MKVIHFSNKGYYNEVKAVIIGSWDIIAKNHTFCWMMLSNNILTSNNIQMVTCKKCLIMMKKKRIIKE